MGNVFTHRCCEINSVVMLVDEDLSNLKRGHEANCVRSDDHPVASDRSVANPKRQPAQKQEEHFKGEVAGLTRLQAFTQLRYVRDRRAESRSGADNRFEVRHVTALQASG